MRAIGLVALIVAGPLAGAGARAQDASEPSRAWSDGPARSFLSARIDAGLYARATAAAGWGRPHWAWGGAQAYAMSSRDFGAVAGGLRVNLLAVDLEVDLRRSWSYSHRFLDAQPARSSGELERSGRARAEVTSLDVDLYGVVPTPGGLAIWEVMWVSVLDLPAGTYVYEEWNRVIQGRDAVLFRAGWLALAAHQRLRIGPLVEAVALPGRGAAVWRAGVAGSLRLTSRLDVAGFVAAPLSSPDRLDALDALNGSLALRWTWATGPTP